MPTLGSLGAKPVLVLRMTASLYEAARALSNKSVGCALVSDGQGHIVGLITDRDLACKGLGRNLSPRDPISSIMTADPLFLSESRPLEEGIKLMQDFAIRRLPLIKTTTGGKNRCTGILSFDDLVVSGEVPLRDLVRIIKGQMAAPRKKIKKTYAGDATTREMQPMIAI